MWDNIFFTPKHTWITKKTTKQPKSDRSHVVLWAKELPSAIVFLRPLGLRLKEYLALRQLCWISKNMYNVALYNVRQHFFDTKTYLNYEENYKTAKCNENYKIMGSAAAQQTMKKVDEAFQSFFGLLKTEGQNRESPNTWKKMDSLNSVIRNLKCRQMEPIIYPCLLPLKRNLVW